VAIVIAVVIAVVVIAAAVFLTRRRNGGRGTGRGTVEAPDRTGPTVAEFHVEGPVARVLFDVPLPPGDVDDVLVELLVREAVEVVRDKRHSLPMDQVERVVAAARRDGEPVELGSVALDTPGELPPPVRPELLPHLAHPGFDVFDQISDLPTTPPGLSAERETETLGSISGEVRLSREVEAGLRAQGVDPAATDACELVLGVMGLAGYETNQRSADTYDATKGGQRVFIRTVCHAPTEHPELDEHQVDRFVVDFVSSGADRGLCITEKYSPFYVYEREQREPRMRFITRERVQDFIDALTVG